MTVHSQNLKKNTGNKFSNGAQKIYTATGNIV